MSFKRNKSAFLRITYSWSVFWQTVSAFYCIVNCCCVLTSDELRLQPYQCRIRILGYLGRLEDLLGALFPSLTLFAPCGLGTCGIIPVYFPSVVRGKISYSLALYMFWSSELCIFTLLCLSSLNAYIIVFSGWLFLTFLLASTFLPMYNLIKTVLPHYRLWYCP